MASDAGQQTHSNQQCCQSLLGLVQWVYCNQDIDNLHKQSKQSIRITRQSRGHSARGKKIMAWDGQQTHPNYQGCQSHVRLIQWVYSCQEKPGLNKQSKQTIRITRYWRGHYVWGRNIESYNEHPISASFFFPSVHLLYVCLLFILCRVLPLLVSELETKMSAVASVKHTDVKKLKEIHLVGKSLKGEISALATRQFLRQWAQHKERGKKSLGGSDCRSGTTVCKCRLDFRQYIAYILWEIVEKEAKHMILVVCTTSPWYSECRIERHRAKWFPKRNLI
jgi:hypothetical protein